MSEPVIALQSSSLNDTHAIASAVAAAARPGDIVVLAGEMGAGKTAFAQGFGRAIGVTDRMTSPTFTLVHSYPIVDGRRAGKVTLHHADLYRLERTAEVSDLALRELADFGGIVLIEWGDVVDLFGDHLVVRLTTPIPDHDDGDDDVLSLEGARDLEIAAVGSSWAPRWSQLLRAVEEFRC